MVFLNLYGPSGPWCWLDFFTTDQEKISRVRKMTYIYYSFIWLLIILNAYFVIKVIVALTRRATVESRHYISRTTSHLKWYPIVLIISFVPGTIRRIIILSSGDENDWIGLIYIQAIFDAIQGGCFALVYSLTPEVRQAVKQLYYRTCLKRTGSYNYEAFSYTSSDSSSKQRTEYQNRIIKDNINEEQSEILI